MKNLAKSFLVSSLFISSGLRALPGASTKASVQVTAVKSGGEVNLTFSTLPVGDLVINSEGPWKLEIKSTKGIQPTKLIYKVDEWKKDISGFIVPIKVNQGVKSGDVEFKLTSFVCTKDKSMCYREVVESKAQVAL